MVNLKFKCSLTVLILLAFICVGCKSSPASVPVADPSPAAKPEVPATVAAEEPEVTVTQQFDESMISLTQKEEEKNEIDALVKELNGITKDKRYDRWLAYLSDEYIAHYSNPEVLERVSARLPVKSITLKNLRDYFMFVFVVSRQNCRVDDISYLTPTRVKVIQREKSKSIIIYNLEKYNGKWKIILDN